MDTRKNILEIKNMHTYFFTDNGVVKSVDGVDIELKEGSTLGIVGESGSGKSVTALSVMGLLMGTTGKVVEAIKMHQNKTKQEAREMAVEMLKKTGLPRVERIVNEYPFQLSGGQRQRVMIAMALVCNPKILIADEPTTALDVTIQAQIIDLMNHLKQEIGTSIMFITHDLGVVAETCDEVVVMYCGRVVEKGNVYDIFGQTAHPYTQGLLRSIPKLGEHVEELDSIPGNVPNPKYMPKGCKFAPRCEHATERCREEEPGFFDLGNGHLSRCWLCER